MRYIIRLLLIATISFSACSADDEVADQEVAENTDFPDFTVLQLQSGDFFELFNFEADTQSGTTALIMADLGVPQNAIGFSITDHTAGFYYENGSAYIVNIEDRTTTFLPNYFDSASGARHQWSRNAGDTLITGFYTDEFSEELNIRFNGIVDFSPTDFSLPFFNRDARKRIVGNILYLFQNTANTSYVSVFDISEKKLIGNLQFPDEVTQNVFVEPEANTLWVRTLDNIYTYDLHTLQRLETSPNTNGIVIFRYDDVVNGNVFFAGDYQQPASLEASPFIYNIITGEETRVDIRPAIASIKETENFSQLLLYGISYLPEENMWLQSYGAITASGSSEGGIFKINASGEIIARLVLPVIPDFVVLKAN